MIFVDSGFHARMHGPLPSYFQLFVEIKENGVLLDGDVEAADDKQENAQVPAR